MSLEYLKELRKNSKNSVSAYNKQIEESQKSYGDDRFWKLTVDNVGNGEALIRFLPPKSGENVAWVQKWSHAFAGESGRWFVENCPTTLKDPNHDCYVCKINREIWNNNTEEVARKKTALTKRNHKFYSNILVVDDPSNPTNNGKVFLFEYGPKIFAKIEECLKPVSSRQKPQDPFNIDTGMNFLLLAKTVSSQRNYDSSRFESPSPISEDDDQIIKILTSTYSLASIISPENFKSYDELKLIYEKVNGINTNREIEMETEMPDYEDNDLPSYTNKKRDYDEDIDNLPF